MGDYYDQAAASDQQAKLDLLGQIAANGSQAAQAFQGAQTQIGQAKADALAQALSGARQRGAPQAEQDQIAATVGHQYDNTLGSLASQAANRASSFGQLSSAAGTYMDQAAASMPSLRNALAEKVATLQAGARAREGQQQFQLEQSRIAAQNQAQTQDLERQRLQLEIAKQQNPDLGTIISQLGGADLAGGQLSGALVGSGQVSAGIPGAQGGSLSDQANRAASIGSPEDRFDPTQRLSDASGIPSAAIGQLVGGYQQKQAAAQQTAGNASTSPAALRQSPTYAKAADAYLNGVAKLGQTDKKTGKPVGPSTLASLAQYMIQNYGPDIARQVMNDYGSASGRSGAAGLIVQ